MTTSRLALAATCVTALVLFGCTAANGDEADAPPEVRSIGDCATVYSPDTLTQRGWAFDGTITNFGTEATGRRARTATFDVHRWFRGDRTDTVTVRFDFPTVNLDSAPARDATVGQRFLVTGGTAPASDGQAPLIAYGCGYTQPWGEATAELWANALT